MDATVRDKRIRVSLKTTDTAVAEERSQRIVSEVGGVDSRDELPSAAKRAVAVARRERLMAPGTVGAMAEMLVCADLLTKGYEVFRSVSPHCSCDLIARSPKRMLRVEVKTAGIHGHARVDERKYDVLALVIGSNRICYRPAIHPVRTKPQGEL